MGKLTSQQRIEVIGRLDSGETGYSLGIEYGIRPSGIYHLYSRNKGYSISDRYPRRRRFVSHRAKIDPDYYVRHYHAKVEELDDLWMIIIE